MFECQCMNYYTYDEYTFCWNTNKCNINNCCRWYQGCEGYKQNKTRYDYCVSEFTNHRTVYTNIKNMVNEINKLNRTTSIKAKIIYASFKLGSYKYEYYDAYVNYIKYIRDKLLYDIKKNMMITLVSDIIISTCSKNYPNACADKFTVDNLNNLSKNDMVNYLKIVAKSPDYFLEQII